MPCTFQFYRTPIVLKHLPWQVSAWERPEYAHVAVLGDWMSKIEGLLRRLVHFCKTQPDVKHLVRHLPLDTSSAGLTDAAAGRLQ